MRHFVWLDLEGHRVYCSPACGDERAQKYTYPNHRIVGRLCELLLYRAKCDTCGASLEHTDEPR